jgi:RimJ/RimL family protein N-acetyltransferase
MSSPSQLRTARLLLRRWRETDYAPFAALNGGPIATNVRSRAVMQRIGMTHDPADDFNHPEMEETDPLRPHVLYRISATDLAR